MLQKLLQWPVAKKVIEVTKKIHLPGFDGLSVFEVSRFFIQRLSESQLQSHARSIAFSFFLALFPAVIFLFTLIPYIPINGFQEKLLALLHEFMPPYTYEASRLTIEDIITRQRGGLLSFGFLFTIYVSSNGIMSMIDAFNARSLHHHKSSYHDRLKSIGLTLLMIFLVMICISLLLSSEFVLFYLTEKIRLTNRFPIILLKFTKWILLLMLCFTAISSLYYFGTRKQSRWRFISAGSTLATILIILTSIAFNYFIANFGQYNKIYGSIGTLIIILVWMNFNCMQLLVGYELNTSIEAARKKAGKIILDL